MLWAAKVLLFSCIMWNADCYERRYAFLQQIDCSALLARIDKEHDCLCSKYFIDIK